MLPIVAADAHRITIAKTCPSAAFDKSMAFPEIVDALIMAGFEGYVVDYRRSITTYFLPEGDSVMFENRHSEGSVAAQFDPSDAPATSSPS